MQLLNVLLADRLDTNEAHARARRRFSNRVRVVDVVLVRLDVRRNKLRTHQQDLVAESCCEPRPVMRATARFHRHDTARGLVCQV